MNECNNGKSEFRTDADCARTCRLVHGPVLGHDGQRVQAPPLADGVVVGVVACGGIFNDIDWWAGARSAHARRSAATTRELYCPAGCVVYQQSSCSCSSRLHTLVRNATEASQRTFEQSNIMASRHRQRTWRDFERARAKLSVHVVVRDDGDGAAARHGHHALLTHQVRVPAGKTGPPRLVKIVIGLGTALPYGRLPAIRRTVCHHNTSNASRFSADHPGDTRHPPTAGPPGAPLAMPPTMVTAPYGCQTASTMIHIRRINCTLLDTKRPANTHHGSSGCIAVFPGTRLVQTT